METFMRVGAVNYEHRPVGSVDEFFSRVTAVISNAKEQGVELLVLPEYTTGELYSLHGDYPEAGCAALLTGYAAGYCELIQSLSKEANMILVGGTTFFDSPQGILNQCPIAYPKGTFLLQAKQRLVAYEHDPWGLVAGEGLQLMPDPKVGTLVCYDCEFPPAVDLLVQAGLELLCVPASTETVHGFRRVRTCCQARAIEYQCFVIHASLVGGIGKEPHPTGYGSAAILAPCAEEFPTGPVLAETPLNEAGIAVADLDFESLRRFRATGEVRNLADRSLRPWTLLP